MRPAIVLVALTLAACGDVEGGDPPAANAASAGADAVGDNRIDCLIGRAEQYQRFCTVERSESAAGTTLTVRKPDGGFRRLLVATDGRGVVAADGAEPAQVTILRDDRIEVRIGGDRFRLPATVRRR